MSIHNNKKKITRMSYLKIKKVWSTNKLINSKTIHFVFFKRKSVKKRVKQVFSWFEAGSVIHKKHPRIRIRIKLNRIRNTYLNGLSYGLSLQTLSMIFNQRWDYKYTIQRYLNIQKSNISSLFTRHKNNLGGMAADLDPDSASFLMNPDPSIVKLYN